MNWDRFCLYGLMCFLTPLSNVDTKNGMCLYYTSGDVDKKSLIIDSSKQGNDPRLLEDCLKPGPYNTILIHSSVFTSDYQPIIFAYQSLEYEHLIVLGNAMPVDFCPKLGEGLATPTSLTVHTNNNLPLWTWLRCSKFKYIHIENCIFRSSKVKDISELIFSEHLLTLTLIHLGNLGNFNPFSNLNFDLAPNLKELSINHIKIQHMWTPDCELCFSKLKRLNLQNNEIRLLEQGFFDKMPLIEEINLEGNQLANIDLKFATSPRRLLLDNNPLMGNRKLCKFLRSAPFAYYNEVDKLCPNEEHNQQLATQ